MDRYARILRQLARKDECQVLNLLWVWQIVVKDAVSVLEVGDWGLSGDDDCKRQTHLHKILLDSVDRLKQINDSRIFYGRRQGGAK